jgi:hypothetical protein
MPTTNCRSCPQIFRQHHTAHHLNLGHSHDDVDAPLPIEIEIVGNSSVRKFLWLTFNMFILPIRSLYKVWPGSGLPLHRYYVSVTQT